jgi:hypothetical protein
VRAFKARKIFWKGFKFEIKYTKKIWGKMNFETENITGTKPNF